MTILAVYPKKTGAICSVYVVEVPVYSKQGKTFDFCKMYKFAERAVIQYFH